jgi:serine phosphatase RsbU (regulator of sigma subunit)
MKQSNSTGRTIMRRGESTLVLSALEIQQAVISDLRHHLGKRKLQDDVTLLVIKQRVKFE